MLDIQNTNLSFPEKSPCKTHQLSLAHGEVGASLQNLVVQPRLQVCHHALDVGDM